MKALLRHSYEDCQANKENFLRPQAPSKDGRLGAKLCNTRKLPLNVPKPKWLANPTHRTKVVAKQCLGMKTKGKNHSDITGADCFQLKIYWGYMLKQN
eukprot:13490403-Ditylum_brightwellii.AAC.1